MVLMDMPMPENCEDCPCSYWIQSGNYEGLLMCSVMEFRDRLVFREPGEDIMANYLVDDYKDERPLVCPITAEVELQDDRQ